MLIVVTTFGFANVIDDLAALELAARPLIASDIIDMDEATPNKQWVDTSGDVSPTGIWYYQTPRPTGSRSVPGKRSNVE